MNLQELKELAEAAQHLPGGISYEYADEYIAACNPQTILELIEVVESLLAVEPVFWDEGVPFCIYHPHKSLIRDHSLPYPPGGRHLDDCPWFLAKERWS